MLKQTGLCSSHVSLCRSSAVQGCVSGKQFNLLKIDHWKWNRDCLTVHCQLMTRHTQMTSTCKYLQQSRSITCYTWIYGLSIKVWAVTFFPPTSGSLILISKLSAVATTTVADSSCLAFFSCCWEKLRRRAMPGMYFSMLGKVESSFYPQNLCLDYLACESL